MGTRKICRWLHQEHLARLDQRDWGEATRGLRSCPISGLQNWMSVEWGHQLGEGILKKPYGEQEGERYWPTYQVKTNVVKDFQIRLVLVFQYFILAHRIEYGTVFFLQAILKPTVSIWRKCFTCHLHLRITMCSLPYLMNINVKSLPSEETPGLYRGHYTENLHGSHPQRQDK